MNLKWCPGISKSVNGGTDWQTKAIEQIDAYLYCISMHPQNSDIVYAGGYTREFSPYQPIIYRTTDGGENWSNISDAIKSDYRIIYSITFQPNSPDSMYATASDGVFLSIDSGNSWTQLTGRYYNVKDLIISQNNPNEMYIASDYYGIYRSIDGGDSWIDISDNLNTERIQKLALDTENNYLYAATDGAGVCRYSIPPTKVESDQSESKIPERLELQANYPNPFNASTKIFFDIPKYQPSPVQLSIYNIAGQLIKCIKLSEKEPGRYSVDWNGKDDSGKNVSSGIYFCVMESGKDKSSLKMTLLR